MLTPYSTPTEIAAEETRLRAERAQAAQQTKINTGNLIVLNFWRRHPDILMNQANEKIIREFIGPREFTAALLDEWLPQFEPRLAKVPEPRETLAYIAPEVDVTPKSPVPGTRSEIIRMPAGELRALVEAGYTNEINQVLQGDK